MDASITRDGPFSVFLNQLRIPSTNPAGSRDYLPTALNATESRDGATLFDRRMRRHNALGSAVGAMRFVPSIHVDTRQQMATNGRLL
ncbi:MAG: hypothetical protein KDA33_17010 [Phycisphaerales bacterium]|nr:hypothetical protein [Phycisphaerales bacterium]